MPQTRQAKKALRKSEKKGERNKVIRSTVKTLAKKTRQAIEKKEANAEELIKDTIKKIDKAIQKGIIKKNTGSRKKSRLMKSFNKTQKAK